MLLNQIYPDISRISSPFMGILLDAYGVFWGGNGCGVLPGIADAMKSLVASGKIVGILSNSTQLASREINKLGQHGLVLGQHFHFLVTSGEVARYIFLNETLPFTTTSNKFWIFGGVHPKYASHYAIFQDTPYHETSNIDEADFIYISIPHVNGEDQTDPEVFRKELEALKIKNLPMICPNPDRFAHEGKPSRAVVRQGSIAMMYEEMGGHVFYIGKPHNKAYSMVMKYFEKYNCINPSDILMVGDTPETDIRGARLFGMPSALVTQTGMMADRIAHSGLDAAIKTLSAQDLPDYLIERLTDAL